MQGNDSRTEIGRRLLKEAQRTAPAGPDFEKIYMAVGNRGSADHAADIRGFRFRRTRMASRTLGFLPYVAAACLALGAGFLLGRFVQPREQSTWYSANTAESGIQNEVRLYLSNLWGASSETVAGSP